MDNWVDQRWLKAIIGLSDPNGQELDSRVQPGSFIDGVGVIDTAQGITGPVIEKLSWRFEFKCK